MKPKVVKQHVTEKAAVKLVKNEFPNDWALNDYEQGTDYGIDLNVEIARAGEMTSERASVQVKETSAIKKPTSIRIKSSTLHRLVDMSDLAFLVMVHIPSKTIWNVPVWDWRVLAALEKNKPQVRISEQADHSFRSKPITDFGGSRSPISVEADHFG